MGSKVKRTYDSVEFQGRIYRLRLIDLRPKWGRYFVASTQLNLLLYDDLYGYTSDEAGWVDELIFYFIPIHYFKLSDFQLRKKILDELV